MPNPTTVQPFRIIIALLCFATPLSISPLAAHDIFSALTSIEGQPTLNFQYACVCVPFRPMLHNVDIFLNRLRNPSESDFMASHVGFPIHRPRRMRTVAAIASLRILLVTVLADDRL